MKYQWIEPLDFDVSELCDYHPVIAHLLAQRGIKNREKAEEFLHPDYNRDNHDPFLYEDMEKAVERIAGALDRGEKVTVYCDYDVDGLSSGTIIYSTLRQLGCSVEAYMNHREKDGYGLQKIALSNIIENGTRLIITTDCGISNASEIGFAREQGVDVIITDHHTVPSKSEDVPNAVAIIHPLVRAENYPCKLHAGGGSAFKLAQALIRTSNEIIREKRHAARDSDGKSIHWEAFEKWLLDLVCLSTIGDCVPLLEENRMFVQFGLRALAKTRRHGLRALLARLKKRNQELSSKSISFFLAPRINAASRMDHAKVAFELLNAETDAEAERIAAVLEELNTERQKLTEKLMVTARDQLDVRHADNKKILVGSGDEWPLGILGLVAGRLCEHYQKPVVLMTNGHGAISGAARSTVDFHIADAFSQISHHFDRYGGHQAAGGFALKKDSTIQDVRESLEELGERRSVNSVTEDRPLRIDAQLSLSDITWDLLESVKLFEPHGVGNLKPRFLISDAVIGKVQVMGQTGKHVRIDIVQNDTQRQCVGFSFAEKMQAFNSGDRVDIICELDENEWNGRKSIQLSAIDIRKA